MFARVNACVTFMDLQNRVFDADVDTLPKYTFLKDLSYGSMGTDVSHLQEVLYILGFFPSATYTGNYYGLTQKAVCDFQIKYGVIKTKEDEGAGRCGPKTRAKLNELCNN